MGVSLASPVVVRPLPDEMEDGRKSHEVANIPSQSGIGPSTGYARSESEPFHCPLDAEFAGADSALRTANVGVHGSRRAGRESESTLPPYNAVCCGPDGLFDGIAGYGGNRRCRA